MAALICDDEDYFSRPNKHRFNDLIGIISPKNGISIRAFQKQKLRPGYWVDTRRFLSKTKRELANGMFEIFGDFSDESASIVWENLMGWIYDNYRAVEEWTHVMLSHKEITLSNWIDNMRKDETPGDNMCLYLLARMYNKHVYVHNKQFYWCTVVHKITYEMDLELINDCEVELVFVHSWVFGEVKRVRIPKGITPTTSISSSKPDGSDTGITANTSEKKETDITENSNAIQEQETKDCSVSLLRLTGLQPEDSVPKLQNTTNIRRSGRKQTVTDYSKLINYDENEDLDSYLPPSLVKRKCPTNLLRKPSRNRQKIERNRKKNKNKKRLTVNRNVRDNRSPTSSAMGTSPPTVSDSLSPEAQPTTLITTPMPFKQTGNEDQRLKVDAVASTSKEKSTPTPSEQNKTIMVATTREETRIAIDALLSLGNDLSYGPNMEPTDNDLLQPIAPVNTVPDPPQMVPDTQSDDTEILDDHLATNNNNNQGEQIMDKTERKKGKGKGQLVVQNFQLVRNRRPKCKFSCVGCPQKFDNNRELNDHFKNSHPPLTCSDCKKLFLTPSAFEKHKYTHYEFMFECGKCNKGFHFESELLAHRRKHISDQGLVCFHANCGRRFKRSSELNAHLKKHTGKPIKCAYCDYTNKDIRNVRAHTRVHLDVQGFVCAKCSKRFKWGSKKKRHLDSGKCPG